MFLSSAYDIYSEAKTDPKEFERAEIRQNIVSEHDRITIEINNRRTFEQICKELKQKTQT